MRRLSQIRLWVDRNLHASQKREMLNFEFITHTRLAITEVLVGRSNQIFVFRIFILFLRGGMRGLVRNQLLVDRNLLGAQKRKFNDCSHKHILSPD